MRLWDEAATAVANRLHGEGHDASTRVTDASDHDGVEALADAAAALGPVTQVADAAPFLLGRQAGFLTGADLLMHGGVTAALRAGELTIP
ncbi:hypothetical protein OG239_02835 [Streptomyces sp. NBC_00868]|uniref:hypothetical protein n=1 Tax=unclassified Streptomyces TaxID=2593676 RepID=UPI003255D2C3|nr:hypothetical protein OG239_02835 [Streptomyces sp. NBC_00868]